MAKAFISYKRAVQPDDELARSLCAALQAAGHQVFIDQVIAPGTVWAERLEKEIAESDWIVVLLSEHSAQSEMVRAEIETARRLAGKSGKPRILPVRVAYREPLPYPLSAYLDGIQWALWSGEGSTPAIVDQLKRAILGQDLPLAAPDLVRSPEGAATAAPTASAQPVAGGAKRASVRIERPDEMHPDSLFYVERDSDRVAREALEGNAAATLTVKGSRQMGKTALLNRLALAARAAKKRVVYLDFKLFDAAVMSDSRALFEQFCAWFADELGLDHVVEPYWSKLPLRQACTKHVIEKLLRPLPPDEARVLLAADELDRLFDSPVRHELFGMLRSWHERRPQRPELQRLDMVLVTSTDPEKFTRDDKAYGSPFNVGTTIELLDFSEAEVASLVERHGLDLAPDQRRVLRSLFGGHPYLTRRALFLIATGQWQLTASTAAAEIADPFGPFGDHLRQYLLQLQAAPDLARELRLSIQRRPCSMPAAFDRLRGAGLLRGTRDHPEARCGLYAAFFGAHLDG